MVIVFYLVLLRQIGYPRRSFVFQFLKNSENCQPKEVFQNMTDAEMEVEQTPPENMETEEAGEAPEEVIKNFIVKFLSFSSFFGIFRLRQIHRKKSVTKTAEFTSMAFTFHPHLHLP